MIHVYGDSLSSLSLASSGGGGGGFPLRPTDEVIVMK